MIVNIIGAILKIAASLISYAEKNQLIEAGEAKIIAKHNENAIKKIRAARIAANNTCTANECLLNNAANRD